MMCSTVIVLCCNTQPSAHVQFRQAGKHTINSIWIHFRRRCIVQSKRELQNFHVILLQGTSTNKSDYWFEDWQAERQKTEKWVTPSRAEFSQRTVQAGLAAGRLSIGLSCNW